MLMMNIASGGCNLHKHTIKLKPNSTLNISSSLSLNLAKLVLGCLKHFRSVLKFLKEFLPFTVQVLQLLLVFQRNLNIVNI